MSLINIWLKYNGGRLGTEELILKRKRARAEALPMIDRKKEKPSRDAKLSAAHLRLRTRLTRLKCSLTGKYYYALRSVPIDQNPISFVHFVMAKQDVENNE